MTDRPGRLRALLARGTAGLVDFVFPRRCGGCGRFGDFFCAACQAETVKTAAAGWSFAERAAAGLDPAFAQIRIEAAHWFTGPLRRAILELKYHSCYRLADPLGELLAAGADQRNLSADLIVPVPLHPARQRDRGFNQAERLARPVSARRGIPIVAGLIRPRPGRPQARLARAADRRANVRDAFAPGPVPVAGRRVLLIDDVTTTGATLAAAAGVLRQAGAEVVIGLALARQPRDPAALSDLGT